MKVILQISMFIIPVFFALFLTKGSKGNRRIRFLQFILYFILINTSAYGISYSRGVKGISLHNMTYSYCIKWLAVGIAFAICYAIGMGYIWKYRYQFKISIILHRIQNEIKMKPIIILLTSAKVLVIVGLYIYGFNCIKNLDVDKTLILSWITIIAFILLFSNGIHSYLTKREIYEPYIILATLTPIWCFYVIEKIYNESLDIMTWHLSVGNIFIMYLIFLLFYINIPYKKAVIGIYWTIFLLYSLGNYYVTIFRGSPVMPNDILSIGTAIQVSGGYSFDISENIFTMSLNYMTVLIMLLIFPVKKAVIQWKYMLVKLFLSIIVVFCLANIKVEDVFDFKLTDWGNQYNIAKLYKSKGSVIAFITLLQNITLEAPENYQRQTVEAVLSDYTEAEYSDADNTTMPTIIVIMDESFADLRSLADFYTSDEYLCNWYNIDDYVYRGNLYVSTYGGRTANTEFEFLTGNSFGNLPAAIVPYQIYNLKNIENITDILKLNGYQTTAIHPANKKNWSRIKVYKEFGFSSFLDIEEFQGAEQLRGITTDKADLDKVIEVFESSDEPQFIFNITIQNHGGYEIEDMEEVEIVELEDKWQGYTSVETYLTLIKESDKAIDKFIDYFRGGVDEPVIICIFGDHWPSLNHTWIEQVIGKSFDSLSLEEAQRLRAVPYMIWSNYDVGLSQQTLDTSANYLGALLLDVSGVSTSPYTEYLLDMRKYVPAINDLGYMTSDGIWHTFQEATDVSQWVDSYEMLQYNAMFDSARDMTYYRP